MSSDVIAVDCRIDETVLLLFKYLYLEQKKGWYTFKVSGQREKRDKKIHRGMGVNRREKRFF